MHKLKTLINMKPGAGTGSTEGIQDLTERVDILEKRTGHIYGIKRSLTTTNSVWERMNDSINLVANATKDGTEVQNDFDSLYPWNSIISYNLDLETKEKKSFYGDPDFKFDGTNGDVYTYYPRFWFKIWQDDEYEYAQIADYKAHGFNESKAFSLSRYLMSYENEKLRSISGKQATAFKNIKTYRNLVKQQLGEKFNLMDYRYFAMQLLYLVEYANFNSQLILGNGLSTMRHNSADVALIAETATNRFIVNTTAGNAFIVGQMVAIGTYENINSKMRIITAINDYSEDSITGKEIVFAGDPIDIKTTDKIWSPSQVVGGCDALGMKSGCIINDGKHCNIYRGFEDPTGDVLAFVDGVNIKDSAIFFCDDPEYYESDKFDGAYKQIGYMLAGTSGFSKKLGFDENYPLLRLPSEVGASSTTGTCDQTWQNSKGSFVARVGGNVNYGTYCGLWYWNLSNTSSTASWACGARVLFNQ